MTLGVTGVVWLPRTATVNSSALLAGAGPAPLAAASGAWQSVAAAYADASITVGRVMAVLAAGWEGEAAIAAQARLGGFLGWTQASAAKATQISALAAGQAAAYTTAALAMPNPVEIVTVKSAKATAYSTGGALNGSAEALEIADRLLDIRAGLVMDAYEAATTPLALDVSFDRPPEIVNDGSSTSGEGSIDTAESHRETSVFGFGTRTSPAQAALAAAGAALQNPALASAAGQVAGTAGSVAGSSVTTVASAATNIGSAAASTLMNSGAPGQGSASTPIRPEPASTGPAATRAVSAGLLSAAGGSGVGVGSLGSLGSGAGKLGGPVAGSSGLTTMSGGERMTAGPTSGGMFGGGAEGAAATRGTNVGAPIAAGQSGDDDEEHETPGYLKQFEHFSDGRTVAPSVIGADPTWIDR